MFTILLYILLGFVCPNLNTTGNASTMGRPDTGGETGHIPPGPRP